MEQKRRQGPRNCLEIHPTHQSIKFAGRFISLTHISRKYHLTHGYLSRIFRGERRPSFAYAEKISEALGMTLSDFLAFLEEHLAQLAEQNEKAS